MQPPVACVCVGGTDLSAIETNDPHVVGEGGLEHAVPIAFSSYSGGMDIGRDNGLVVDLAYEDRAPYAFTGTVRQVVFDLKPASHEDEKALGLVYSMGAALLDRDEPWKVIARGRDYLLSPQVPYEQVGDVQNVVFPCAALVERATDRLTIYHGGADTVTCMAHGYLSEVVASTRA